MSTYQTRLIEEKDQQLPYVSNGNLSARSLEIVSDTDIDPESLEDAIIDILSPKFGQFDFNPNDIRHSLVTYNGAAILKYTGPSKEMPKSATVSGTRRLEIMLYDPSKIDRDLFNSFYSKEPLDKDDRLILDPLLILKEELPKYSL